MKTKLTESKVREILRTVEKRDKMRAELKGMTNKAMAEKYGVHERTVDKCIMGLTWKYVGEIA